MNKIWIILIAGFAILIGAIIVNLIVTSLNITTWFTLASQIGESGLGAIKEQSIASLFFLFIIYPLILGGIAYYIVKALF